MPRTVTPPHHPWRAHSLPSWAQPWDTEGRGDTCVE
uniref:Uncharacterized protein n=1 Tax=Arundo donax TaxID=35708 RepID=A0A0A9BN05_ARUDO